MKKFMLWVMVAVCVVVSVEPVFASYKYYSDNKSEEAKIKAFNKKMETLVKEVEGLADKITAYNKPVFEAKLTKKEREQYDMGDDVPYGLSSTQWNRVYAKGKTIVFGIAGKNKKFKAHFFKTCDPELVFSNGIRVGASVNVLERYLGDTLTNAGYAEGKTITVYGPDIGEPEFTDPAVSIVCQNGVIKEIHFGVGWGGVPDGDGDYSKKALDFANKQARQMGFSGMMPKIYRPE